MNPPRIADTPITLWAIVDPDGALHPGNEPTEEAAWYRFAEDRARREWDPMTISFARQGGWPDPLTIEWHKERGYRAILLACTTVEAECDTPS